MKVYLCIEVHYNFCDTFEYVHHVTGCEVKALIWKEEVKETEMEWREYREMEVE